MPSLAAYPRMLEQGRMREGLRACRVAYLLGMNRPNVSVALEGERSFAPDEYERACQLFGWPQRYERSTISVARFDKA